MLPDKPAMYRRLPVRGLVVIAAIVTLSGIARTANAQIPGVKPFATGVAPVRSHGTRPINQLPYWVSRQDCLNDDVMTFAVGLEGAFNGLALEAWAGTADCSPVPARTGSTPSCWKVGAASTEGNSIVINVPIRAQDIVAHNTPDKPLPTPNDEGIKPGKLSDCTSTANTAPQKIILDFMLVTAASNQAQPAHQIWDRSGYDIWGPVPPTNVGAAAGETRIHLSWAKSTSTDTLRYDIYCDPPPGLLADAGLKPLRVDPFLPGLEQFAVDSGVGGSGGFGGFGTGGLAIDSGVGGTTTGTGTDAGTTVTTPGSTCTPASALVPGTPPDKLGQYLCGSVTGLAATSTVVEGLINDVPYTVAVVAVDQVNNSGNVSGQACATPIEVTDFFELYRLAGGTGGGGLRSITRPGSRVPWLGAVLGGMAVAWLARRRGRR